MPRQDRLPSAACLVSAFESADLLSFNLDDVSELDFKPPLATSPLLVQHMTPQDHQKLSAILPDPEPRGPKLA
ncbi:hypothetical protein TWF281_000511 [Arthrobotrys megalospora]